MKSIYLLLLFAIFFVQCSTQKFTAEEKALIEKYQMPNFSSDEINRFALDYLKYFEEVRLASESGDQSKIYELSSKGADWAKNASKFIEKMTAEDAQKWVELATQIAIDGSRE